MTEEWANTRAPEQRSAMVTNYGAGRTLEAQIDFLNGITQSIRAEAERRRHQLIANANKSLADRRERGPRRAPSVDVRSFRRAGAVVCGWHGVRANVTSRSCKTS